MQLTGKEIVQENIIQGYVPEAVQQQGIDLRLREVREFGHINSQTNEFEKNTSFDCIGLIPTIGKTRLPQSRVVKWGSYAGMFGWKLEPGYYEVIFEEGCEMPKDRVMVFITRSSGVRCGVEIVCGQFDAGFKTDHMGCFMRVHEHVFIGDHARIAQTRITKTAPVDDDKMYNGQWQNDNQRAQQK